MRIIRTSNNYGHNLHHVELEADEYTFTDERLITMADRHGELSDADWQAILDGKHMCHFGGTVERADGSRPYTRIKVYID